MTTPKYHRQTLAIRGARKISQFNEHSQSLFLTSSFTYPTAADAAALFLGEQEGFTYSRFTNPTVSAFQERAAQLEGAERGMATASGMSALQATFLTFLSAGDHLVASRSLFGSTVGLIGNLLPKIGIEVSFVDLTDLNEWQGAIKSNTKMLFLETPSNPVSELADLPAIAAISKKAGTLFVVDNCFCSPAIQQPIKWGADIVVNSATKAMDGQGRVMGGVVCGRDDLIEQVYTHVRTAGQTLAPFNAWVLLSGLETLFVRMEKQCANALEIAQWLEAHPAVNKVHYPGLTSHPQHELAKVQQDAFGCVLSFEVKGGKEQAWHVVDTLELFSRTANFGDVKSTITHPYTTTHSRVTPEDKARAGITEGLVRLSIGLEHTEDLKADLQAALS